MDEGEERILERERFLMDQIRELDDEELQVEEVEGSPDDYSDDDNAMKYRGSVWPEENPFSHKILQEEIELFTFSEKMVFHPTKLGLIHYDQALGTNGTVDQYTFNTCLASLHTYLGEVEDTHHRMAVVDSGTILTIPLFYLQGVVLFPEATLPLRIIQPNFIVAIDRAMGQVDSPYTIGVVRVYWDPENGRLRCATVGTTAEIRQYRRLEDGSVNVVTRGKQRFHVRRYWLDVDGAPCGEVEVIEEDLPLRTPRDAFGTLPPLSNLSCRSFPHPPKSSRSAKWHREADENHDSEPESDESFLSELSLSEMRLHQSAVASCCACDMIDESTSSDDEKYVCDSEIRTGKSQLSDGSSRAKYQRRKETIAEVESRAKMMLSPQKGETSRKRGMITRLNRFRTVPRAFWPYWVYQMYDSYSLAQRAADMWKQIVGAPSMYGFVRKPDILSFYIASKIPVSESTRQELLEINGISYRLQREIDLLEGFDRVRCKNCQTVLARRSDMLVMSTEGPLGAYVNPNGYVHEVMTLHKANGLALIGRPTAEYSWFPGYSWTIANCATCERHMGWLFTATNKKLKPKSFYGIRSSQVADDMR